MKSLQLSLPDPLMTEVNDLVHDGWFRDKNEVVRAALVDFVRRHRFALLEKLQREDIAWALKQKGKR
jgi:Arc/MetJ-type ribon-helix-helix transcriptional regulator